MEKKKIAKGFMLAAILTGCLSAIEPFINEAKAEEREASQCCPGSGKDCSNWLCNEDKTQRK